MIINSDMANIFEFSENFRKYLDSKGLRNTFQRYEIIKEIFRSAQHSTAEEIYSRLRKKNSKIGFATVCRNLKLLCQAGLLEEIKVGNEQTRYEIMSEKSHHDHLICLKCGRFIEVFSEKLEELQNEMAEKEKLQVIRQRLEIYGICIKCRGSQEGRGDI